MRKPERYPLIIIGAGPAGLSASIYASRYNVPHLVIGAEVGGLMAEAHKICNFPTEEAISGAEITNKIKQHAESLGAKILSDRVKIISFQESDFSLVTQTDQNFLTQTLLLAIGTRHRKLGLPEEERYLGKGVSYCVTCDAQFYHDQVVAVVGSGNSASTASLYLANIAKKVYQICRGDQLHGERVWIDQVTHHPRIKVIYRRQVAALEGEENLTAIILDKPYQKQKRIPLQGLFIEIGTAPRRSLIQQLSLATNPQGYIKVATDQRTSNPRVWAAGDITDGSHNIRQIVTAASEGVIAAASIFKFLQKNSSPQK